MLKGFDDNGGWIKGFLTRGKRRKEREKEAFDELNGKIDALTEQLTQAQQSLATIRRAVNETNWAHIFNSTIAQSAWLKDKTFAPGRMAAGYPLLYVIYRVLNEMHPRNILELGLGQTTKMISQYAAAYPEVKHTVVEQNSDWISFFSNDVTLPANSGIVRLDYEITPYRGADVRVFKEFAETFGKERYDCVIVDAPFGGDMVKYSRIDVLSLIPQSLSERFVILIDDTHRPGENATASRVKQLLREQQIEFKSRKYSGEKDSTIICDAQDAYLASL